MNIHQFRQELFRKGQAEGFTDMEIFYSVNKSTTVNVQDKAIKSYVTAEQGGVSFRGVYQGRMGYSYTEKLDEASLHFLLVEARANAEIIEADEQEGLFAGGANYAQSQLVSETIKRVSAEEIIAATFNLENAALSADPAIERVIQCKIGKTEGETVIANTQGLSCQASFAYISAGVYLMAKSGSETTTGGEFDFSVRDFAEIQLEDIAKKAAAEAVSQLGAASVFSGNYPVVLHYKTATTLMSYLVTALSGETVEKGFSRLEGKIGKQIAGSNITLVEDPLLPGILGAAVFDAEGYPTGKFNVIERGVLKTFLHNRKTAKKAKTVSTGNAVRSGYSSTITVGPHNVYLKPGEKSLEQIIGQISEGILITELQGMHAGINTVSGDFSLAARGFLIQQGQKGRPVSQITVAGNLYELIRQVEEIACDLKCKGSVSSPSLKLTALTISGE